MWLGAMVLVFLTPEINNSQLIFEFIPPRAFINCFMFLGLVHIWIGSLIKQIKFEWLRRHAFKIVVSIAILIAVIVEGLFFISSDGNFRLWSLIFDIIGSFIGIVSFKLLYRSCY